MTPRQDLLNTLGGLNATYRFTVDGGTVERNPISGQFETASPDLAICEIIDLTTGEGYVKMSGSSQGEALERAVAAAIVADKPMTPAQRYAGADRQRISILDDENAALKARLAALERGETPPPYEPIATTIAPAPVAPPAEVVEPPAGRNSVKSQGRSFNPIK